MSAPIRKKRGRGTARPMKRRSHPLPRTSPQGPSTVGLDEDARTRARVLARMKGFTLEEARAAFIRAGIIGKDGKLTAWYRDDEPSKHRPTD